MFRSVSRRPAASAQYRAVATSFFFLGFHVGVWAVQLPEVAAALRLSPGPLGVALAVSAVAGLGTLFAGGVLADRLGRRLVLVLGFGGTATAFALLSLVDSYRHLVAVLVLYGLFVSFIDLGVNTVGADFEHAHERRVMTGLHANFSAGAVVASLATAVALWAGVSFRLIYVGLAVILLTTAIAWLRASLPHRAPHDPKSTDGHATGRVWHVPGVAFAIAMLVVAFFADGALDSFLGVFLTQVLSSGVLLSGIGIASFHLANLIGLTASSQALARWGERRVITAVGILSSIGIAVSVTTDSAVVAIIGLLVVGLTTAPIAPSALSLAGRSAPGRSGQAVALTTAGGYGAFIIAPAIVGGLAALTSLRVGLGFLILTMLAVAVLGTRWPPAAKGGSQHPSR